MHDIDSGLQDIAHIRAMMQRATKFLSLSGLSGIGAGVVALAGVWFAAPIIERGGDGVVGSVAGIAAATLAGAVVCALLFSYRMARARKLSFWNAASRNLLLALAAPLAGGGVLSISLAAIGTYGLIPAAMLLFYGVALLHAADYTLGEVRYLGLGEMGLGALAAAWPGSGLLFWALGFGALHVVYGVIMWIRYERKDVPRPA